MSLSIAVKSPYDCFWIYRAAKDLELAIRLYPNDSYARHNYAQAASGQVQPSSGRTRSR